MEECEQAEEGVARHEGMPWPPEKVNDYLRSVAPEVDTRGHLFSKLFGAVFVFFLRLLSWNWADRLGKCIGLMMAAFRVRRDIAMTNLDIAYGDTKTRKEKLTIFKESWINIGRHVLNYARTPLMDEEFWRTRFEIENEERMHEVLARGKGMLVVGGHLGEWDLAAARVGMSGYPTSMVAKRMRAPIVEKFLIDARLQINLGTIFGSGSMDHILATLRRGEMITMAIDQNMRQGKGTFVEWMGRPASTVRSSAYVVRETGATALVGVGMRTGPGRFKLIVGEEIPWVPHPEDPEQELLINTRKHVEAVEKLIYQYPPMWMWIHRRWKHQPDGAPSPYKDDVKRAKRRQARAAKT